MWPFTESEWRREMTNVLTEEEIPEGAITGALFRLGSFFYRDNLEDRRPARGRTGGATRPPLF